MINSMYAVPSVINQMAMPVTSNDTINRSAPMGGVFKSFNNPMESSIQGQISRKFRNKDIYDDMKNKTIYSSKQSVQRHATLNTL